ncbi:MAG: CocE/NonD family hydrolase [Chloroflexi bacterium]|nr:MAG: CocE/NonD family hydrolase [Chloroflexota bacterium]
MGDVIVEFNVPVRMRDGVALRTNVYRPSDGRHPVLLTRTPYGKDFPNAGAPLDPAQVARRGYVVAVQDVRGRFASEGEWGPFVHEACDGVDSIGWAASLPYGDGRVGTFGGSYVGFTQFAMAAEAMEAVRAITPTFTWGDPFDGQIFRGGAFELGLGTTWSLLLGLNGVTRRHAADPQRAALAVAGLVREFDALARSGYASLPLREFAPLFRHGLFDEIREAIEHPMDRSRAHELDVAARLERVSAPAFIVGGWYDIFLKGTLDNYAALRKRGVPAKLLIGPWAHIQYGSRIGEMVFGFAAQAAFIDLRADLGSLLVRWFDRWVKGEENGVDREPPVLIFVMGANRWRAEAEWPPAGMLQTSYFLRGEGGLSIGRPSAELPDEYVYDPRDPVPTLGGATLLAPEFPAGAYDQRPIEAREDVLSYTTEPLSRDTDLIGPVRVHLIASSSAPDTDFVARLVDVHPDGYAQNLTDGIVRARYRDPEHAAPIEPGRPYEFVIDLWATANRFFAGHRIRLDISSSSFPRWDRNPGTGHPFGADAELQPARQSIFHDAEHPSRIVLPVVPA